MLAVSIGFKSCGATKVSPRLSSCARLAASSRVRPGVHPRHAGTHTACAGNGQHRGGVAAHLHDLKVGDAEIRRLGRGGGGGAAGQISQTAGGCGHQLFRLGIHAGEEVIDVPAVFIAQRGGGRGIDQVIEVVTVTLCAGHPPALVWGCSSRPSFVSAAISLRSVALETAMSK